MRPALVWRDGGALYGLSRRDTLVVMRDPPMSAVPSAPPWLRGLANRFGRAVPVVDCRLLAGGAGPGAPIVAVVVLAVEGGELGLAATAPPQERVVAHGGDTDGFFELPPDPERVLLVDTLRLLAAINRAMG